MVTETGPPISDVGLDPANYEGLIPYRSRWDAVAEDCVVSTLFVSYLAFAGLRPCHKDAFRILAHQELKDWSHFFDETFVSPRLLISWGVLEGVAIDIQRMAAAFFRHNQEGDYVQLLGGDDMGSGGLWGCWTCNKVKRDSPAGSVLI